MKFTDLAQLPNLLQSEVIEMVPLKPEETLHNYLRRHFEKVSKGKARQFAEQKFLKWTSFQIRGPLMEAEAKFSNHN
jgi:hypothetical protein